MGEVELYFGEVAEFRLEGGFQHAFLFILHAYQLAIDLLYFFLFFDPFGGLRPVILFPFSVLFFLLPFSHYSTHMHNSFSIFPENHRIFIADKSFDTIQLILAKFIEFIKLFIGVQINVVFFEEQLFSGDNLFLGLAILFHHFFVNLEDKSFAEFW